MWDLVTLNIGLSGVKSGYLYYRISGVGSGYFDCRIVWCEVWLP